MDPTLIEHQIVEAEAELFISGVFDRRPTGTPSFFSKLFNCNRLQRFRQGSKLDADSQKAPKTATAAADGQWQCREGQARAIAPGLGLGVGWPGYRRP
jgi:hypothetical protein